MLNCFITLAGVLCLAFAIHGLADAAPSATPVIALCLWICSGMIFGMAGLLLPGVIFTLAVSVFLFGYTLYKSKNKIKERLFGFFTPGVTAFVIACFAMAVVLQAKQPLFGQWDEFSFWGLSQKIVGKTKSCTSGVNQAFWGFQYLPHWRCLHSCLTLQATLLWSGAVFTHMMCLFLPALHCLGYPLKKGIKHLLFPHLRRHF